MTTPHEDYIAGTFEKLPELFPPYGLTYFADYGVGSLQYDPYETDKDKIFKKYNRFVNDVRLASYHANRSLQKSGLPDGFVSRTEKAGEGGMNVMGLAIGMSITQYKKWCHTTGISPDTNTFVATAHDAFERIVTPISDTNSPEAVQIEEMIGLCISDSSEVATRKWQECFETATVDGQPYIDITPSIADDFAERIQKARKENGRCMYHAHLGKVFMALLAQAQIIPSLLPTDLSAIKHSQKRLTPLP